MKRVLSTIFIVLALDQVLKIWVKTNMWLGEDIELLGDWLILSFTENPGMAFGMELGGDWGKIILSVFRVVAVIIIAFYIRYLIRKEAHKGLLTAIAFIFAGAMGNIIDSAVYGLVFSQSAFMEVAQFMPEEGGYAPFLYGNVVDMIKVKYFPAVFNLADFSITLGVVLIILRQRTFFPKDVSSRPLAAVLGTDDTVEEVKDGEVDLHAVADAQAEASANSEATTSPESSTPPTEPEPEPEPEEAFAQEDTSQEPPAAEDDATEEEEKPA